MNNMKIIWIDGEPTRVPSTLEADAAAGVFRRRKKAEPSLHRCGFCSWVGDHSHYYDHWREHHYTRAGHLPHEVRRHA